MTSNFFGKSFSRSYLLSRFVCLVSVQLIPDHYFQFLDSLDRTLPLSFSFNFISNLVTILGNLNQSELRVLFTNCKFLHRNDRLSKLDISAFFGFPFWTKIYSGSEFQSSCQFYLNKVNLTKYGANWDT